MPMRNDRGSCTVLTKNVFSSSEAFFHRETALPDDPAEDARHDPGQQQHDEEEDDRLQPVQPPVRRLQPAQGGREQLVRRLDVEILQRGAGDRVDVGDVLGRVSALALEGRHHGLAADGSGRRAACAARSSPSWASPRFSAISAALISATWAWRRSRQAVVSTASSLFVLGLSCELEPVHRDLRRRPSSSPRTRRRRGPGAAEANARGDGQEQERGSQRDLHGVGPPRGERGRVPGAGNLVRRVRRRQSGTSTATRASPTKTRNTPGPVATSRSHRPGCPRSRPPTSLRPPAAWTTKEVAAFAPRSRATASARSRRSRRPARVAPSGRRTATCSALGTGGLRDRPAPPRRGALHGRLERVGDAEAGRRVPEERVEQRLVAAELLLVDLVLEAALRVLERLLDQEAPRVAGRPAARRPRSRRAAASRAQGLQQRAAREVVREGMRLGGRGHRRRPGRPAGRGGTPPGSAPSRSKRPQSQARSTSGLFGSPSAKAASVCSRP